MIQALSICTHLEERLIKLDGTKLMLHSAFDQAVNFMAEDDHLITFLAQEKSAGVSSIRLPASQIGKLLSGFHSLQINGSMISAPGLTIQWDQAERIDPAIDGSICLTESSALVTLLREAIIQNVPSLGIYHDIATIEGLQLPPVNQPLLGSQPIKSTIAVNFSKLFQAFKEGSYLTTMTGAFRGLVGYGHGLTPGADDFLTGFLAATSYAQLDNTILLEACKSNLHRTTFISSEMLYHASERRFSQSTNQLFKSTSTPQAAIADILSLGHSSGHDTLCGIYAALKLASFTHERGIG